MQEKKKDEHTTNTENLHSLVKAYVYEWRRTQIHYAFGSTRMKEEQSRIAVVFLLAYKPKTHSLQYPKTRLYIYNYRNGRPPGCPLKLWVRTASEMDVRADIRYSTEVIQCSNRCLFFSYVDTVLQLTSKVDVRFSLELWQRASGRLF